MIDMIHERIKKRSCGPSIRDLDITVADVLDWLGSGQTAHDILAAHPTLDHGDLIAVFRYAAHRVRSKQSVKEAFAIIHREIEEKLGSIRSSAESPQVEPPDHLQ
jgi:uncharacterized protein (DUF433 family)